jgi:GPH family glycoside/pentoside/hexuronide:cation symporter
LAKTSMSVRLPLDRLLAFVSPALPLGAVGLPLIVYLPVYFTSYVGLRLAVVGFAFFLVRSLDIGFDPLMGWLVDRTRTPWGQCRPWMAAGAVITFGSTLMLFLAPPGTTLAYLVVGLLLLYAGTSIVGVAQPAWAARLAPDYDGRSHLYAWMQVAASIGIFVVLALPMFHPAGEAPKPGSDIHRMGLAVAIALPVAMALALWRTPEPHAPVAHVGADGKVRLIDYAMLLRRPDILRLVISNLFVNLATATVSAILLFFWRTARGYSSTEVNWFIILYFFGSLVSVPVWVPVGRLIGKRWAFILSGLGYVIMPLATLIPRHRPDIVLLAQFTLGLTFGAGGFLVRAMAADAADEARLDTGVDRLGQVYALLTSTTKVGSAVAVGVVFAVLDRAGFNATLGGANPSAAMRVLVLMYAATPAVLTLFGLLAVIGYRLDRASHDRVRERLATRDAEAAAG